MSMTLTEPRTIYCGNRAEWLERRREGIGASDTAGIFGVGYADQSPITVWDSKVNRATDDRASDRRLTIGLMMEPALRNILQDETGFNVRDVGEHTIHQHPELPWMLSSLDSEVEDPDCGWCPGELKAIDFGRKEWADGATPLKYEVQVQHQLCVTGKPRGYLLGLIGLNPVVRVIERNDRFIEAMLRRLAEFWSCVESRKLPPIDDSLATASVLSRLWPQDDGETVQLPDEASEWDAELTAAKADKKSAESREALAANKLKAAMGAATFGRLPDGTLYSWKTQERSGYTVAPSSCRVLRRLK